MASNGIALHVRPGRHGDVLLLHCVGLDANLWLPLLEHLPQDFTVRAVDVPGHGLSTDLSPGQTLAGVTATIASALRECAVPPSVVVGISMGGMIAQYLAIAHADLVRGLVLGDTSFRRSQARIGGLRQRAAAVRSNGPESIVPETLERWFSRRFVSDFPEMVEAVAGHLARVDRMAHARTWELLTTLDTERYLPDIGVPACVLVGEHDTSTPPAEAQELARRIPGASYRVIPGAGHISVLEQPAAWAATITDLLAKTSADVAAPASSRKASQQ